MPNIGLYIDHHTRDIVIDPESYDFKQTMDADTVAQCVKATLQVYKEEWFLDIEHGTAYREMLGVKPLPSNTSIQRILREAIYQEPDVQYINRLDYEIDNQNRSIHVLFDATLVDGMTISVEVEA